MGQRIAGFFDDRARRQQRQRLHAAFHQHRGDETRMAPEFFTGPQAHGYRARGRIGGDGHQPVGAFVQPGGCARRQQQRVGQRGGVGQQQQQRRLPAGHHVRQMTTDALHAGLPHRCLGDRQVAAQRILGRTERGAPARTERFVDLAMEAQGMPLGGIVVLAGDLDVLRIQQHRHHLFQAVAGHQPVHRVGEQCLVPVVVVERDHQQHQVGIAVRRRCLGTQPLAHPAQRRQQARVAGRLIDVHVELGGEGLPQGGRVVRGQPCREATRGIHQRQVLRGDAHRRALGEPRRQAGVMRQIRCGHRNGGEAVRPGIGRGGRRILGNLGAPSTDHPRVPERRIGELGAHLADPGAAAQAGDGERLARCKRAGQQRLADVLEGDGRLCVGVGHRCGGRRGNAWCRCRCRCRCRCSRLGCLGGARRGRGGRGGGGRARGHGRGPGFTVTLAGFFIDQLGQRRRGLGGIGEGLGLALPLGADTPPAHVQVAAVLLHFPELAGGSFHEFESTHHVRATPWPARWPQRNRFREPHSISANGNTRMTAGALPAGLGAPTLRLRRAGLAGRRSAR
ncbi:hypothetical protein D3C71_1032420 [compost metagenome]